MKRRILECKIENTDLSLDLDDLQKIFLQEDKISFIGKKETNYISADKYTIEGLEHFIEDIAKYITNKQVTGYVKSMSHLQEDDTQNKQQDDQNQQQPIEEEQPQDNGVQVDPEVDSAEQVAGAAQNQQNPGEAPIKMPAAAPMPAGIENTADGKPLELADGTSENVAQDSSLQYNAINPEGIASISFKSGNFAQVNSLPQVANQKVMTITKTIVPLVEAGLIELLGNNKSFKGDTFNASFTLDDEMLPKFDVRATYSVEVWIGTDVAQEDIAEDANYLLERLKVVPDVEWRTCKIDCTKGSLELEFSI